MSLEFLISKIKKNNFLLIGRAGIDIYPDPPGTKTENAKNYVTYLGGSSANMGCLLYTSPSPRDLSTSRMPSSA